MSFLSCEGDSEGVTLFRIRHKATGEIRWCHWEQPFPASSDVAVCLMPDGKTENVKRDIVNCRVLWTLGNGQWEFYNP